MQYLGGKSRTAKLIGAFLNAELTKSPYTAYVEPFCGACWISERIDTPLNRLLSDTHPDLILLWQALQEGWEPPTEVSEETYNRLKTEPPSALRAFAGFGCSFGGKFFKGYARRKRGDNYARVARDSLLKKLPKLHTAQFAHLAYSEVKLTGRCLIYCDPPYASTTGYSTGNFDSAAFWQWVRQASTQHRVIVSEYEAPADFREVMRMPTTTELRTSANLREPRIEKLFEFASGQPTANLNHQPASL